MDSTPSRRVPTDSLPDDDRPRSLTLSRRVSIALLAVMFTGAGLLHFVHRRSFEQMVPQWLPNPGLLVVISGIAEMLGGVGLLRSATRVAAGWGLVALLIAVFPANVHMLADARAGGTSALWEATLWVRLPLQLVLIWWVWRTAIAPGRPPRRGGDIGVQEIS